MSLSRHAALVTAAALCVAAWGARAEDVTIYRCTDAAGHQSLSDRPCRKGETQQTRTMARPKDAPRPPAQPASAVRADARDDRYRDPAPRYVMVTPARPMYECVSADGETYMSETGVGRQYFEPNYIPALAYPGYGHRAYGYQGVSGSVGYRGSHGTASVSFGGQPLPVRPPHHGARIVPVISLGEMVRDECYTLPQAETCDRLRDQRHELTRRWNIAQPTERAQIDLETRGIDARLDNDCGGR